MADEPQLTTDQQNFCRAVDAMKLDLLRSGKEPGWLAAHPGVHPDPGPGIDMRAGRRQLCGLQVVESSTCPPGSFYLAGRRAGRRSPFLAGTPSTGNPGRLQ